VADDGPWVGNQCDSTGEASMGRLNKIFEEIPEISDIPEAIEVRKIRGED